MYSSTSLSTWCTYAVLLVYADSPLARVAFDLGFGISSDLNLNAGYRSTSKRAVTSDSSQNLTLPELLTIIKIALASLLTLVLGTYVWHFQLGLANLVHCGTML